MRIHANTFAEPDDLKALLRGVELAREIGNDPALKPYAKREVMPGNLGPKVLERVHAHIKLMTPILGTCAD